MKHKNVINRVYFNEILNYVNQKLPPKRKVKYTPSYYLHNFLLILKNVTTWSSLSYIYSILKM